jgi:hypothetical protein
VVCKSAISQELFPNPPVPGAPFSAEVTTVWHPPTNPEMRATAYYYRDSAGRVRVEQTLVGRNSGPQRVIVMPEPSSARAYVLDPIARTNTRIWRGTANMMTGAGACQTYVLPVSITRFLDFIIHGPQILDPTLLDDESLGARSIAGVHATGTRFTMVLPGNVWIGKGERWISPELKLVVSSHGENPQIGSIDYEMTKISVAEPPAHLFELPDDYAVMPDNAITPLCWGGWGGPHSELMRPCENQDR